MKITELKKLFLILSLSAMSVHAQVPGEDHERLATKTANKNLARAVSQVYHEKLLTSLVSYNKETSQKLSQVLSKHNHKKLAQRVQGFNLPALKLQQGQYATTQIGPHTVRLNAKNLFDGVILMNDKAFDLTQKLTLEMIRDHLQKSKKVSSTFMDLFISKAHAQDRDPFEIAVFATLIAMQDNFDEEWCLMSECKEDLAKRNFKIIMNDMEKKARACQTNPESKAMQDLAYDISDFVEYTSGQYEFEKVLDESFNEQDSAEATCQGFVEKVHHKEVKERTSRNERRGYLGGGLSIEAEENKQANSEAFNKYIRQVCRPYVELRNCLVQKRYSRVRRIYDGKRDSGKKGAAPEQYDVKPRSNATGR